MADQDSEYTYEEVEEQTVSSDEYTIEEVEEQTVSSDEYTIEEIIEEASVATEDLSVGSSVAPKEDNIKPFELQDAIKANNKGELNGINAQADEIAPDGGDWENLENDDLNQGPAPYEKDNVEITAGESEIPQSVLEQADSVVSGISNGSISGGKEVGTTSKKEVAGNNVEASQGIKR